MYTYRYFFNIILTIQYAGKPILREMERIDDNADFNFRKHKKNMP